MYCIFFLLTVIKWNRSPKDWENIISIDELTNKQNHNVYSYICIGTYSVMLNIDWNLLDKKMSWSETQQCFFPKTIFAKANFAEPKSVPPPQKKINWLLPECFCLLKKHDQWSEKMAFFIWWNQQHSSPWSLNQAYESSIHVEQK